MGWGGGAKGEPGSPTSADAATPTFTGSPGARAVTTAFMGSGFSTSGQVVTTTDNQTMTLNECTNMWLITATHAPCLIVSNAAVDDGPAVLTVMGAAPPTTAEDYMILTSPAPVGTVSSHTHTLS